MILNCKICGDEVKVPDDTTSVMCSRCTMKKTDSLEIQLDTLRTALRKLEDRGAKHSSMAHKTNKEIVRVSAKLKEIKDGSTE
jgi:hypothetical protein